METYEDDLTEWYWHHQKENLTNWLCIERVLDPGEEGKDFFMIPVDSGRVGGRAELKFGMNLLHTYSIWFSEGVGLASLLSNSGRRPSCDVSV